MEAKPTGHGRGPGWADDRIPEGYVSKQTAATMLRVSTVTLDRWSRPRTEDGVPVPPMLRRYSCRPYPYTLFKLAEITRVQRKERVPHGKH